MSWEFPGDALTAWAALGWWVALGVSRRSMSKIWRNSPTYIHHCTYIKYFVQGLQGLGGLEGLCGLADGRGEIAVQGLTQMVGYLN